MSADWRSGRFEIVWIASEIVWKRLKTSDPDVSDFWGNSDDEWVYWTKISFFLWLDYFGQC